MADHGRRSPYSLWNPTSITVNRSLVPIPEVQDCVTERLLLKRIRPFKLQICTFKNCSCYCGFSIPAISITLPICLVARESQTMETLFPLTSDYRGNQNRDYDQHCRCNLVGLNYFTKCYKPNQKHNWQFETTCGGGSC